MFTYSFLDVHAAMVGPGGALSLGAGSANAEEGITITANEEIGAMTIGADGSVMHSLHANKSGKVKVTLLKTSPVNMLLMAMYLLQTASGAAYGQNTLSIVNSNTLDAITCQLVAFAKAPEIKYQKEGGFNEWEFNAGIIDRILGNGSL